MPITTRWHSVLHLLRHADPFLHPTGAIAQQLAESKRAWGSFLVLCWLTISVTYWCILWTQDLARPDAITYSTQPSQSMRNEGTFIPSSLMVEHGLMTAFLPNAADVDAPCMAHAMPALQHGTTLPPTGVTLPLCPATRGRKFGAPSADVGGVVLLMQLALECPPFSVDTPEYVNGFLLSDLLVYRGLPQDTLLGTIVYGSSRTPVYARDVQARVCKPPAIVAEARVLPSTRRVMDTSRIPMLSVQLRLRMSVFSNGTSTATVASSVVQAREDDVWDVSGGDATSLQLPTTPVNSMGHENLYPAIAQLRRRGVYGLVMHYSATTPYSTAKTLRANERERPFYGSVHPMTRHNAEHFGNWTVQWAYNDPVRLNESSVHRVLGGAEACAMVDSMNLTYIPMSEPRAPSHLHVTMVATGAPTLTIAHVSSTTTSPTASIQAQNAAYGMGCGLVWARRAPHQRACRATQILRAEWSTDGIYYGSMVFMSMATIEDDAFIKCKSGAALPVPLTDVDIVDTDEDDVGERVMDKIGRQYGSAMDARNNFTSSNVCVSGGACLFRTRDTVQTVGIVISVTPEQDVVSFTPTRQGSVSIFSQAAGVMGLAWTIMNYVKAIALKIGERRKRAVISKQCATQVLVQ